MKVNNPNTSSSQAATGASQARETVRAGQQRQTDSIPKGGGSGGDDIHLSELVRSLRSLAADSPQRQEHLEKIARAYATGNYQVNPHATAAKIIEDASKS
jgi:flagellar biosynthesis anti-sigma factor FlgM